MYFREVDQTIFVYRIWITIQFSKYSFHRTFTAVLQNLLVFCLFVFNRIELRCMLPGNLSKGFIDSSGLILYLSSLHILAYSFDIFLFIFCGTFLNHAAKIIMVLGHIWKVKVRPLAKPWKPDYRQLKCDRQDF